MSDGDKVVRIADYERRSRTADSVSPRDPADTAVVIILPVETVKPRREPPVIPFAWCVPPVMWMFPRPS